MATQWFHTNIVQFFTTIDAHLASIVLNIFGFGTRAIGSEVSNPEMAVNVKTGCDGLESIAMFGSGVVAFTAPWLKKLKGFLLGFLFLFSINLIRIIHLWLTGLYMPNLFDFFHESFWQIAFILLAIVSLAFWISKIQKVNADD